MRTTSGGSCTARPTTLPWRFVAVELLVVGAVSGIAVALAATAPPARSSRSSRRTIPQRPRSSSKTQCVSCLRRSAAPTTPRERQSRTAFHRHAGRRTRARTRGVFSASTASRSGHARWFPRIPRPGVTRVCRGSMSPATRTGIWPDPCRVRPRSWPGHCGSSPATGPPPPQVSVTRRICPFRAYDPKLRCQLPVPRSRWVATIVAASCSLSKPPFRTRSRRRLR